MAQSSRGHPMTLKMTIAVIPRGSICRGLKTPQMRRLGFSSRWNLLVSAVAAGAVAVAVAGAVAGLVEAWVLAGLGGKAAGAVNGAVDVAATGAAPIAISRIKPIAA